MAKRMRKSEREYINARNALMRSIQRTNKAFGSNMKLTDIVDVPTPSQAKKMSYKELKAATKKIQKARVDDKGEKLTYVPTGTGNIAKIPLKDYNRAMSALGKSNKALRERMSFLERARLPKKSGGKKAKPVSVFDVQASRGQSKVTPTKEVTPAMAFTGGKAKGNVDEILKRFQEGWKVYAKRPREWKQSDDLMKANFKRILMSAGRGDLYEKFKSLTDERLLWALYERNLGDYMTALGTYITTDPKEMMSGINNDISDDMLKTIMNMISDTFEEASQVEFTEEE